MIVTRRKNRPPWLFAHDEPAHPIARVERLRSTDRVVEMTVELEIRAASHFWDFRRNDESVARSIVDPMARTSRAEIRGLGKVRSQNHGLFWAYRFRIYLDDEPIYSFRRSSGGGLLDPSNRIAYTRGRALRDGTTVFRFPRDRQNRFRRSYFVCVEDESFVPLAVCFFPVALVLPLL